MRSRTRSLSIFLGLLAACLSVAALIAAPAGASPVTTAHAAGGTASSSWIQISNRYSGRCIDDPHQSRSVDQPLQQYSCNLTAAQQWETTTDDNGYFIIYNNQDRLCLADEGGLTGEGVPVVQAYCDDSPAEQWQRTPVPGLSSTFYFSSPVNQWRVLSVPDWGTGNGDPLQLLGCGCGAYQQWVFTYMGNLG